MSFVYKSYLHYLFMSQVKDGNYNTRDHNMNRFDEILERMTCFKYVNVSFIETPQL